MNVGIAVIVALFSMFLVADSTKATMVMEKSFDQLAKESELIFEGHVISKETRTSPINDQPFTYFTFEIIDVIKGDYRDRFIELPFMGGPQGNRILKISGMQMPEVGERGIYFIKTLGEENIHPLSGWHQGHYLVMESEQNKKNVVVPVLNRENPTRSSKSAYLPTVEEFKEKIRKSAGEK